VHAIVHNTVHSATHREKIVAAAIDGCYDGRVVIRQCRRITLSGLLGGGNRRD
jgi:hypothetical protein